MADFSGPLEAPTAVRTNRRTRRILIAVAIVVYALVLLASHIVAARRNSAPAPGNHLRVSIPLVDVQGEPASSVSLRVDDWPTPQPLAGAYPIVLLHGSPGRGRDFSALAPLIAQSGRRVLAPDLPGFGESDSMASHSLRANGRVILSLLGALEIEHAHIVGWSNGGGAAMFAADFAPDRVASLTLLGSIGRQEDEGSGSYAFEQFKYAVGFGVIGVVPELLPHFGVLGTWQTRTGWLRNFSQSDQRELTGLMARLKVPTQIIHGRHDVLVPFYAAEEQHHLIPQSTLIPLDANHFIPFTHADIAAQLIISFAARHDQPSSDLRVPPQAAKSLELTPDPVEPTILASLRAFATRIARDTPWWVEAAVFGALAARTPSFALAVGVALVSLANLDLAVLAAGILGGIWTRTALHAAAGLSRVGIVCLHPASFSLGWQSWFHPATRWSAVERAVRSGGFAAASFAAGRAIATLIWTLITLIALVLAEVLISHPLRERWGVLGALAAAALAFILASRVTPLIARRGRQGLAASLGRIVHHEYWPTAIFYAPLFAWALVGTRRSGGITTATCCNPTIAHGGGIAGESKYQIMSMLAASASSATPSANPQHDPVLPTRIFEPGPVADRLARLEAIMNSDPAFATFPIILKPDHGERGFAVKLIASLESARWYFTSVPGSVIAQPFHPGPEECGILWVRGGSAPELPVRPGEIGRIFSITKKQFPIIEGDGRRTLEELIFAHPRFRKQAPVFLTRLGDAAWRVPAAGERIRLSQSGNHCQGTLFYDGEELRTPALERAIDALARRIPRLDLVRFDLRYSSDDSLRRGVDFVVLEMNGTSAESTNIYDPQRSIAWAYRIVFRLWNRMYRLGAERRAEGVTPLGVLEVIRITRRHFKGLRGPSVAD